MASSSTLSRITMYRDAVTREASPQRFGQNEPRALAIAAASRAVIHSGQRDREAPGAAFPAWWSDRHRDVEPPAPRRERDASACDGVRDTRGHGGRGSSWYSSPLGEAERNEAQCTGSRPRKVPPLDDLAARQHVVVAKSAAIRRSSRRRRQELEGGVAGDLLARVLRHFARKAAASACADCERI